MGVATQVYNGGGTLVLSMGSVYTNQSPNTPPIRRYLCRRLGLSESQMIFQNSLPHSRHILTRIDCLNVAKRQSVNGHAPVLLEY